MHRCKPAFLYNITQHSGTYSRLLQLRIQNERLLKYMWDIDFIHRRIVRSFVVRQCLTRCSGPINSIFGRFLLLHFLHSAEKRFPFSSLNISWFKEQRLLASGRLFVTTHFGWMAAKYTDVLVLNWPNISATDVESVNSIGSAPLSWSQCSQGSV